MNEEKGKTIRVAAIQMTSGNGDINKNLAHAVSFINDAAQRGAKLILLPEFMATGYILTKDIWNAGEPKNGPTVKWLKENSKRLGLYMGASYLEAEGEDFFNTFVLTTPDGEEAGRVMKQTPPSMEACFTKGASGPHVIDTELGKIGVGICYENWLSYIPRLMHQHSVDIMLMPNSAPTFPAKGFIKTAMNKFSDTLKSFPTYYAKLLGIPVVFSNKCGPGPKMQFFNMNLYFPGFTAVADSDGSLKVQMEDEEGIIVEDVTLDPARKARAPSFHQGRWALDVQWTQNISQFVDAIFRISYLYSSERKRRAQEISQKKI